MAGFRNIPHGKVEQLISKLAEAGFDEQLIDQILADPKAVKDWEQRLRQQTNGTRPASGQLFRTPKQVFDAFAEANARYGWFTRDEVAVLRKQMPTGFVSKLDSVLTLTIWLGALPKTIEALWDWNVAVHGKNDTWRWDGLQSDAKHLRLLKGKYYGSRPLVGWVVLDLTANRGKASKDVRGSDSADLQLLTAAALHPEWPPAIDYDTIPGVWLAGLEATVPGEDAWRSVPILIWFRVSRTVYLCAYWDGNAYPYYSVPVVREL